MNSTSSKLMNSIQFALKSEDKDKIYSCEKEFRLSQRGCRIVRKLIGNPVPKSSEGIYFGSDLQTAILRLIGEMHEDHGIVCGDWIWNAIAKCYGITDREICERPPSSIPPRLPKYAR